MDRRACRQTSQDGNGGRSSLYCKVERKGKEGQVVHEEPGRQPGYHIDKYGEVAGMRSRVTDIHCMTQGTTKAKVQYEQGVVSIYSETMLHSMLCMKYSIFIFISGLFFKM